MSLLLDGSKLYIGHTMWRINADLELYKRNNTRRNVL